ncbi:MAG TPA: hypothetical protein VKA32_06070 [Gammaproteobacteria bacterium]|nr:hypothetical protein [Gammaproteobacteria bacterium]
MTSRMGAVVLSFVLTAGGMLVTGNCDARGGGSMGMQGGGMGGRSGPASGVQRGPSGNGSGDQSRDRQRDQTWMRSQMQQMDYLRQRLRDGDGGARRQQLMNEYGERIRETSRYMRQQGAQGAGGAQSGGPVSQRNQQEMRNLERHREAYRSMTGEAVPD